MNSVKVWDVGSEVVIGGDIKATITAISVRQGHSIQYECIWWIDGTRHSAWLSPCEVEAKTTNARYLGFHTQ